MSTDDQTKALPNLLSPLQVGNMELTNRVVMAPLTRCRAVPGSDHVPSDLMVEYYAQRASKGSLLIAEATMAFKGQSTFWNEPGVYSDEQVAGWKKVVDAVHAKGGFIYLQIWSGGRAAHPLNSEAAAWDSYEALDEAGKKSAAEKKATKGEQPVSASAIRIASHQMGAEFNPTGQKIDHVEPRALTVEEIKTDIVGGFVHAAKNAVQGAGFDGVEIHGANGYLIDQFLRSSSNQRPEKTPEGEQDPYNGSSLQTRAQILLDIVAAVGAALGGQDGFKKVGVRLSPLNSYQDMKDEDPVAWTEYLSAALSKAGPLAYLHLMRADFFQAQKADVVPVARKHYKGVLMTNMGYSATEADQAIEKKDLDIVAFGMPFITNPDFVARLQLRGQDSQEGKDNHHLFTGKLLAENFYSHGAVGYTDYPAMKQ